MADNTRKITVSGVEVQIDDVYNEGHPLTANEAAALNQMRAENIRNNTANEVKKLGDEPDPKAAQKIVSDYAKTYEFGQRASRGGDPVRQEAMYLARSAVKDAIARSAKHNLKDFSAKKISELAGKLLDDKEKSAAIWKEAKATVDRRSNLADSVLPADL